MTDGWAEENELDRLAQWEARTTGDPFAFDAAQYIHESVVAADPDDDYPPEQEVTD